MYGFSSCGCGTLNLSPGWYTVTPGGNHFGHRDKHFHLHTVSSLHIVAPCRSMHAMADSDPHVRMQAVLPLTSTEIHLS